jgi:hypothetical protein
MRQILAHSVNLGKRDGERHTNQESRAEGHGPCGRGR